MLISNFIFATYTIKHCNYVLENNILFSNNCSVFVIYSRTACASNYFRLIVCRKFSLIRRLTLVTLSGTFAVREVGMSRSQ